MRESGVWNCSSLILLCSIVTVIFGFNLCNKQVVLYFYLDNHLSFSSFLLTETRYNRTKSN